MKKNLVLIKRMFLSLVVIIGVLSIFYLVLAFIGFAGMLDNGGVDHILEYMQPSDMTQNKDVGDILEYMKSPIFSFILFGSIIWTIFLKKTRKRFINETGNQK